MKMVTAFAAALLGTLLFMTILQSLKQKNTIFVPLIGIMLGSVIDAVTTVIAYRYDLVQNISTWMMGNFSMVIKGRYELLYFKYSFTGGGLPICAAVYHCWNGGRLRN